MTRYSLKFIRWSLLVAESIVTCFARCRSCSLRKLTRYSLPNWIITSLRSCSLPKIICYSLQNPLVGCWRSRVIFVTLLKNNCIRGAFLRIFCEILRAPILLNICERLLLKIISKRQQAFYSFYLNPNQLFHHNLITKLFRLNWRKCRSSCSRVVFRTAVLKNSEIFQENIGGCAFFSKSSFDTILMIRRKHIDDIWNKLADVWHFILLE